VHGITVEQFQVSSLKSQGGWPAGSDLFVVHDREV